LTLIAEFLLKHARTHFCVRSDCVMTRTPPRVCTRRHDEASSTARPPSPRFRSPCSSTRAKLGAG